MGAQRCSSAICAVFFLAAITLGASCAGGRKLGRVRDNGITASVSAGTLEDVFSEAETDSLSAKVEVVEVQDLSGNRIIMNAVLDEESGEMVASEQLDEIVVEARFRHVAERNGKVDIVFELAVPAELQKSMWQVRFTPKFAFQGDTLNGEKIFITGENFRKVQEWEYRMYNTYVERVVPENMADTMYDRTKLRERFIARYGEEKGREAAAHYRMSVKEKINRRLEKAKGKVYDQFVVDPYPNGGVRLDSVVYNAGEEKIRYFYVQTIPVTPGLKRVDMVMEGDLHTNGRQLCKLRGTDPITYYISSISAFTDNTERYLKKVVYRDLHFETMYNIGFEKGKWEVDRRLFSNATELHNLKKNLSEIMENEGFVMDSILITAACSPEGNVHLNNKLSMQRGESIKKYVLEYMRSCRDSMQRGLWEISMDDTYDAEDSLRNSGISLLGDNNVKITGVSEDWETFYRLVEEDSLVHDAGAMVNILKRESDWDKRERLLRERKDFIYIQDGIYPKLRRVKFNFKLHRKGMLKDTVHTTVLDSVYMQGVEALRNRDYKVAVKLLRPYGCYNTAVAYVCMDYNNSALEILGRLPRDARRDYMLAVVHSRLGNEKLAVEYFLNSVEQDDQMRYRGNLDPEISVLIKKYGMFNNQ